jgi:hypothetical protein
METTTLEGTWEEILLHAPQLAGQRVKLTILSPQPPTPTDRQQQWAIAAQEAIEDYQPGSPLLAFDELEGESFDHSDDRDTYA